MKVFILFLLSSVSFKIGFSQNLVLDSISPLPNIIHESSGLLFFNNNLITHTDSDGESALYEIDSSTAQVLRTVYILNATNKDWEDICQDNDHIYIGDFGNNQGNRTDLKILKINKSDYLSSDTIFAEIIDFSYEDQVDFTTTNNATNFDAEALISYNDSLYIFTKNWGDKKTNIYKLSKTPVVQIAQKIASYNTLGYVTGADYNDSINQVLLCGYSNIGIPYIYKLHSFTNNQFFNDSTVRYSVDIKQSTQIEAICSVSNEKYFVSSEKFYTAEATLHSFKIEFSKIEDTIIDAIQLQRIDNNIQISPNPVHSIFCLDKVQKSIELYDSKGKFVKKIDKQCMNIEYLKKGVYYLKVSDNFNKVSFQKIIKN